MITCRALGLHPRVLRMRMMKMMTLDSSWKEEITKQDERKQRRKTCSK